MDLTIKNLPRMIDISCVRTDVTKNELEKMVALAKKYNFICCFAMPSYTEWLSKQLKNEKDILCGGVIGFPSGSDTTQMKVFTANQMKSYGCNELDMVINVGKLLSKDYNTVKDDIKAVVNAAEGLPVKCIMEVAYLTDEDLKIGSKIAVEAGVTFVKTGTGWANKPTTVSHINIIKDAIGSNAQIKAAGGVRDLKTINEMIDAGCTRFGIGINSIINILKELGEEYIDLNVINNDNY